MAHATQEIKTRFPTGPWAIIRVYLSHDESTAVAAVTAAIGVAALGSPPPANIVIPAVLLDRAGEIVSKNGPNGTKAKIECPLAFPAAAELKYINGQ